jgi:hypothetical protein
LTDVPESEPSFAWAVTDALRGIEGSPLTRASLDGYGRLSISFAQTVDAVEVRDAVLELFAGTRKLVAQRSLESAEDESARDDIAARFEAGLAEVGCPVSEVAVVPKPGYHGRFDPGRSQVRIVLPGPDEGAPSSIGNGCQEHYARHFPDDPEAACGFRVGWSDVVVPIDWDPGRVGRWLLDAVAFHEDERRGEEDARCAELSAEEGALEEMKRLL